MPDSDFTEPRAGYDVSELMWLIEATFGTTPTTGAWKFFGDAMRLTPAPQKSWRDRIGLGRQIPKGFTQLKKWLEPTLEYDILLQDETVGEEYEWVETIAAIMGEDAASPTIDLEKRILSRSIGAKLDLPSGSHDEFWLFKGAKAREYELFSAMDDNVHARERLVCQNGIYGTADYVSGDATRKAFPTTRPLINADCDVKIQGASVLADALSWRLRIARELEKHGSKSGSATLFDKIIPQRINIELEVVMDFVSRTHLSQFLDVTKIYAELLVPSGSGGRTITLSTSGDKQGVWKTLTKPVSELDLIGITLRGEFDTAQITSIA